MMSRFLEAAFLVRAHPELATALAQQLNGLQTSKRHRCGRRSSFRIATASWPDRSQRRLPLD